MVRGLVLAALLGVASCVDPEIPTTVTGEWGGTHLGLIADVTGADLEYDCASGRISEPIVPNSDGKFVVSGRHFPGHGGPIRIDEEQEQRPARYEGLVQGMVMSITVTLTDTGETLGSFALVRGATPHVFKCL